MLPIHYNYTSSMLAFFPNTRGVGYAFFESSDSYTHSGMITTRNRFTNERYVERMKSCINTFRPQVVILEEYRTSHGSVKSTRIAELIEIIALYAKEHNIQVVFYKRSDIRTVFSLFDVMKKHSIASLLCTWIPALQDKMYVPRSGERMEPYSSAIFDAVSLVVTHVFLSQELTSE